MGRLTGKSRKRMVECGKKRKKGNNAFQGGKCEWTRNQEQINTEMGRPKRKSGKGGSLMNLWRAKVEKTRVNVTKSVAHKVRCWWGWWRGHRSPSILPSIYFHLTYSLHPPHPSSQAEFCVLEVSYSSFSAYSLFMFHTSIHLHPSMSLIIKGSGQCRKTAFDLIY